MLLSNQEMRNMRVSYGYKMIINKPVYLHITAFIPKNFIHFMEQSALYAMRTANQLSIRPEGILV